MSRKPHQPAELGDTAGPMPAGHAITIAHEQEAKQIEQDMLSLAMQDVGSLRALDFIRKISGRAQVEIYLRQVKTRAYKAVSYTNAEGKTEKFPDIDTFCAVYLGESGRNLRNKAANYHLLGAELFEVSERLGFKGKDYSALKALPADDQEVIKQAMSPEADRDQVIDLLQEMAARHASEKAALTAKATEAEETAEARSEVIARKETRINEQEETIHKLKRRQSTFTDEEKCAYECAPLHDAINESMVALLKMATEVKRLVEEVGGELVTEECFHAVLLPIKRALEIAAHNGLHIDLATLFDEQLDAPLESLQARAAGLTPGALQ